MGTKNCAVCGNSLQPMESFCGSCGTPITPNSGPTIPSTSAKRTRNSSKRTTFYSSNRQPHGYVLPPTQPAIKTRKTTIKVPAYIPNTDTANQQTIKRLGRLLLPLLPYAIGGAIFLSVIVSTIITNSYQATAEYRLNDYCSALAQREYKIASTDLENRITQKIDISQDQLKTRVEADANSRGGIGKCKVSNVTETGTLAIGTVTYTYGDQTTSTRSYKLFKDYAKAWFKIMSHF